MGMSHGPIAIRRAAVVVTFFVLSAAVLLNVLPTGAHSDSPAGDRVEATIESRDPSTSMSSVNRRDDLPDAGDAGPDDRHTDLRGVVEAFRAVESDTRSAPNAGATALTRDTPPAPVAFAPDLDAVAFNPQPDPPKVRFVDAALIELLASPESMP